MFPTSRPTVFFTEVADQNQGKRVARMAFSLTVSQRFELVFPQGTLFCHSIISTLSQHPEYPHPFFALKSKQWANFIPYDGRFASFPLFLAIELTRSIP
jgi:hypothetical protein